MNEILILTKKKTNRLEFAAQILFKTILGQAYQITEDENLFLSSSANKISYTEESRGGLHIVPDQIVFETGISAREIDSHYVDGIACLFPVRGGALPFDPFAAAFYISSRYEEYLSGRKDRHRRFRPSKSIQYKLNLLERAVVHDYAHMLAAALGLKIPGPGFRLWNTFDIDMAWAYKHKGFLRNFSGLVKEFLSLKFKAVRHRMSVLMGLRPDPYDNFDYMLEQDEHFKIKSKCFVLLGDYSRHNKNLEHSNRHMRALVQRLSAGNDLGIHFSYHVHHEGRQMEEEMGRLEEITGASTGDNRFHYLRFSLPDTFNRALKAGISRDFSMGHASRPGFRAGLAVPFPFYDLISERITDLVLVPFMCMDSTLQYYLKLNPENALAVYRKMADEVARVNGLCVFIWHNNSLSDQHEWKGWRRVYESVLSYCKSLEQQFPSTQKNFQE